MKVYVAGHTGLVGTATSKALVADGHEVWAPLGRYDLRDQNAARHIMRCARKDGGCDAVVLAAAHVGGIGANTSEQVAFLVDNLKISTNVISLADELGFDRLVNLGSSCIYPRDAKQPMREEALLSGPLEPTNEGYAIAKIAALKMVQAYRSKGRRYISLMPTNLYGDNDTYDRENSHVIPSLIMKFEEARLSGIPSVVLWGTGTPLREFLHADDLGRAIVLALEDYDDDLWLNVGSDVEISIEDLAYKVMGATGYRGGILWTDSRPDGTPRKKLDWSRAKDVLGWKPTVTFEEGLRRTVEDFRLGGGHARRPG